MHASVALTRSAHAASLELIAGPSGMGTKAMYKMPTTMAPPKVVKNAVAIRSFIVAPQQRCHHATVRRSCAFLQATRKSPRRRAPGRPGGRRAETQNHGGRYCRGKRRGKWVRTRQTPPAICRRRLRWGCHGHSIRRRWPAGSLRRPPVAPRRWPQRVGRPAPRCAPHGPRGGCGQLHVYAG